MTAVRDLNTYTTPWLPRAAREIFNPINAWPDASGQVYVATYRVGPDAVIQCGYDPGTGRTWIRTLPAPGAGWSIWTIPGGDATKTAPVIISKSLVGNARGVVLGFDLVLDAASVPLPVTFTITDNAVAKTVQTVLITGSMVTLSVAMALGGPVLVSYAKGATPLQSLDGGVDVLNFTNLSIPVT